MPGPAHRLPRASGPAGRPRQPRRQAAQNPTRAQCVRCAEASNASPCVARARSDDARTHSARPMRPLAGLPRLLSDSILSCGALGNEPSRLAADPTSPVDSNPLSPRDPERYCSRSRFEARPRAEDGGVARPRTSTWPPTSKSGPATRRCRGFRSVQLVRARPCALKRWKSRGSGSIRSS